MKIIKTRKDVSVWIISFYMISVNLICWKLFNREIGLAVGNLIGVTSVALFVFWVKSNPKIDKWLETDLNNK